MRARDGLRASVKSALIPAVLGVSPVVGVLLMASPSSAPALVSILRIAVVAGSSGIVLYAVARACWGSMRASNAAGMGLVALSLYPIAYASFAGLVSEELLSAAYGVACLALVVAIGRTPSDAAIALHQALGVAAVAIATAMVVVVFKAYAVDQTVGADVRRILDDITQPLELPASRQKPDVYHLVLDGFSRQDVLARRYKVDLSAQIADLRDMGFVIGEGGFSNYVQTHLTLASMLNVTYLDELADAMGASADRRPLMELISNARIPRFFRELGYYTEFIGTGYASNGSFRSADLCDCPQLLWSEAEVGAVSLTPFRVLLSRGLGHRGHYERSLEIFRALTRNRSERKPTYVFAHSLVPHPPFVLDESGSYRNPGRSPSVSDASWFPGSNAEYADGYRRQALFAASRAVEAARQLQQKARRDNRQIIIIIHGDHGARMGFDAESPKREQGPLVLPIFIAIKWHDGRQAAEIESPVQIYSYLLREVFGVPLPAMSSQAYLSPFSKPYQLMSVDPGAVRAASR